MWSSFLFILHTVLILGGELQADAMSCKPAELSGLDTFLKAPLTQGPSAHPDHTETNQDNVVWRAGESDDVKKKKKRAHLKTNCFQKGFFRIGVHYKIGDYCLSL